MPASVFVSPPAPPMVPLRIAVVAGFTSMLPPPAPSVMPRAEVSVEMVASVPDVVVSPKVRPPVRAPSSPLSLMVTVLPSITLVPPE